MAGGTLTWPTDPSQGNLRMMESHRTKSLRIEPLRLLALALACLLPIVAGAREEYSDEGFQGCLECHETPDVLGILDTVHAKESDPDTPASQKQCQSCHGPSAVHMRFPMQVDNVHFGKQSKNKPEVQNKMCLECHHDGERKEWEAGAHGYEHVVCSTCHGLHDPEKNIPPTAKLSSGCTESCHEDLMGGKLPSDFSHALGEDVEGKETLTCADCHNPHGPLNSGRCSECHEQTPEIQAKHSEKARRFHKVAEKKGTQCMRCHKGIAHTIPPLALEKAAGTMKPLPAE